jgi:YidC/Oxa1 family membrane protein insertase
MEETKRVQLAVGLSLLVLVGWTFISSKISPPPKPTPPAATAPAASQPAPASGDKAPAGTTDATAAAPGAAPAATQIPEQRTVVERPGLYRVELTNYGAAITSFELLDRKYFSRDMRRLVVHGGLPLAERRQGDGPTDVMTSYRPALVINLPNSGLTMPATQAYKLERNELLPDQGQLVVYALETPEFRLQKTFLFSPKSYEIDVGIELQNRKSTPVSYHLELGLEGYQDPTQKPGSLFSERVPQNEVLWDIAGKRRSLNLEALRDNKADADELRGNMRWIGIGQQYFILAAALPSGPEIGDKQGAAHADPNGALSASVEFAAQTLQPGQTSKLDLAVYGGPKLPELLEAVSVNGQPAGLATSIDYTRGLKILVRSLLWTLRQLAHLVHSWALAIVLLTCLVKLLTLYPSHKSMQSMKKIAKLKPEIDKLQKEYADDKIKLQEELGKLYRKHGANPLGGCLPLLIQMPIYFALYSMLGNAVELYRVRLLWIPDLTASDPYFILPLVTGALMYLQTKLTPAPADPQQRMMTVMMPLMFTAFSIFLPAGLTLYIMTNTILGMIQQALMNRSKEPAVPAIVPSNKRKPARP